MEADQDEKRRVGQDGQPGEWAIAAAEPARPWSATLGRLCRGETLTCLSLAAFPPELRYCSDGHWASTLFHPVSRARTAI